MKIINASAVLFFFVQGAYASVCEKLKEAVQKANKPTLTGAEKNRLHQLEKMANCFVSEYEQAVQLGTSIDYECKQKANFFTKMNEDSAKNCADDSIDFKECVIDLLLQKDVSYNLKIKKSKSEMEYEYSTGKSLFSNHLEDDYQQSKGCFKK